MLLSWEMVVAWILVGHVEIRGGAKETKQGMRFFVSHDRSEETPEAKARWFQSLTLPERMDLFCEFTELALSINPRIAERRNVTASSGRVQILSIPRR
jgi:hypothetical protein